MSDTNPMRDFNESLVAEYRANAGRITGPFAGAPVLLLTTTGARTGEARTTPLVYGQDGDRYFVIASKGGAPTHPAWFHNLSANPAATVELGAERFDVTCVVAGAEERQRLFDAQAARMPNFADYQRSTTRVLPVVILKRT